MFAEETRPAYDRVALSSYVDSWDAGVRWRWPPTTPASELRLGDPVRRTSTGTRAVVTHGQRVDAVDYDALVLATGSYPFVPPVPGRDLPGCLVYRTIDDLDAIRAAVEAARGSGRRAGDGASAAGCSGWRRRTRCAAWESRRTSSSWRRG